MPGRRKCRRYPLRTVHHHPVRCSRYRHRRLRSLNADWRSFPSVRRRTSHQAAYAEKPVIKQRTAQSDAQTITFTFALLPVIWVCRIVTRESATAVFIAQTQITKELQFGDRWEQFPFFAAL